MRNGISTISLLFREVAVYNLIFTLISADLLVRYGAMATSYIFWIKVFGHAFISLMYHWFRQKHLYFFYNLGYNQKKLITLSLAIDTSVTFTIFWLAEIIFR